MADIPSARGGTESEVASLSSSVSAANFVLCMLQNFNPYGKLELGIWSRLFKYSSDTEGYLAFCVADVFLLELAQKQHLTAHRWN